MNKKNPLVLAMCFFLASCGSSVEGVYSGEDTGFLDQIELKSNHKAELTFMGMVKEGTYEVEDGRVKINNAGDISILRIDDAGCLDGGGILGKYCKGQAKSTSTNSTSKSEDAKKPESAPGGLVGNRFAAGPTGDEMIVEFLDSSTVRMTVDGNSEKLKYVTKGDKVVISGMDGQNMTLAKRGVDLEGGPDGMIIVFKRRK